MANFPKFCYYYYYFVLALLATSFFIDPALSDEPTQKIIERICRQMEEYAFCENTFKQNLISPNADIVALTQITIEQATANATNTHSFITGLLENINDTALKDALITCENAYRLVMGSFDQAVVSFFERNYDDMLNSERPAPRAQASCTTIFNTPPNPPNPIGDRNRQMRILIAMAIAAGTDLTKGS